MIPLTRVNPLEERDVQNHSTNVCDPDKQARDKHDKNYAENIVGKNATILSIMGTRLYLSPVTVLNISMGVSILKFYVKEEKRLYCLTAMRSLWVNSQQVNDGWSLLKIKASEFLSQFHRRRDRLVVRTLRCGRSIPGSNPGHGKMLFFVMFFIDKNCLITNKRLSLLP